MFEAMTPEQRQAWLRKVRAVDAAIKETERAAEARTTSHRLHLVPPLHLPHTTHGGKALVA